MNSNVTGALAVAAILAFALFVGCSRYNECRRIHPIWYCVGR